MALMHGKYAEIQWDAQRVGGRVSIQHGQNWSLDTTHDAGADITSMQDTWKTYLGGYQDWTATVECLLPKAGSDISVDSASDPNGLADVAATLELYLVSKTGEYKMLYGDAVCNGISFSADKDGTPLVTYSFQGAGQVQWYAGATRKTYA